MSAEKELSFFVEALNWSRGIDWYRAQFSARARVRGEASPGYACYPQYPGVPARMHAVVPQAKLIYLVRDPVARLLSHYRHNVCEHREARGLEEAVRQPESIYVARSRYFMQLEQYLPYYPPEQILIVQQEALRTERRATLRRVFAFLGVNPDFFDPRMRWERHRTDRKRQRTPAGQRLAQTLPMRLLAHVPLRYRWPLEDAIYWPFSRKPDLPDLDPSLRRWLEAQLADDAHRLCTFAGERFEGWSV